MEKALNDLIDAWEALPGSQRYSPETIERWMRDRMKPAMDKAREVLGRSIPH